MFGRLPPVGNPILLREGAGVPQYPGYEVEWLDSGTGALSLAMQAARSLSAKVDTPEVVLPAYGCPDLVAAAVHAGVRPVLADIGAEDPGYRMDALESALTSRTVAVVAVNFLGIAERLFDLMELLQGRNNIVLIEDNAQWYPTGRRPLVADYVCLSFGRGKPVSVMGGGALLRRIGIRPASLPFNPEHPPMPAGKSRGRWELALHNVLLNPLLYGLVSWMPGTNLGITRLKRLTEVRSFPPERLKIVAPNVESYLSRPTSIAAQLSADLSEIPGLVDLTATCWARRDRMLRLPVLLPSRRIRDCAVEELVKAGVGATKLYGIPLAQVPGVGPLVRAGEAPGAASFAARLATIPIHGGVNAAHIRRIKEVLRKTLASNHGC